MNSRVLYVGNRRVDLPDSVSFNLVWQCAEPGELKIYGSGSSTIKLPFTPTNNAVFQYCRYLTVVGGMEFETFQNCRYYERGMLMIDNGTAYLTGVSDGYELCLTWGNGDLVQKLKDTKIYDVDGIGTFKWDRSEIYPLAETSESPDDYPAFFRDDKGALTIRIGMTRPLANYADVLNVAGINQDTIPADVYRFIKDTYLQVNGTQAVGYYKEAVRVQTGEYSPVEAGVQGAGSKDDLYYLTAVKIGQVTIGTNGVYNITVAEGFSGESGYTLEAGGEGYFNSFCLFMVEKDYGKTLTVGRETFITNVFADGDVGRYENTYRCVPKNGTGADYQLAEKLQPVAMGYTNGKGTEVAFFDVQNNFGSHDVSLDTKTYYIYICPKSSKNKVTTGTDGNQNTTYQRYFEGYVDVDSTATFIETTVKDNATRIESPDDEILKTSPPDKITMLGYDTAAEIAEDFLSMFPLMCQPERLPDGTYRIRYFGFADVYSNLRNAYDWSGAFVRLDKIQYGNGKTGLRNSVRFADYGDYAGFRADGSFSVYSLGETENDYAQLKKIANYDYTRKMEVRYGEAGWVAEAGEYPLVKVSEKDGVYASGGMNSVPSVFFWFDESYLIKVQTENQNGTTPVMTAPEGYYAKKNTFGYMIEGERRKMEVWQVFLHVIRRQKTVTVTLNINPGELQDFDFRRPVYIKQLSVYLFAQKITYKGDGAAELQGIVLPSTATGTPFPVDADGVLVDAADNYVVDSADNYVVE